MNLDWEEIATFSDEEISQLVAVHTHLFIKEIEYKISKSISVSVVENNYEKGIPYSKLFINFRRTDEASKRKETDKCNSKISDSNERSGRSTQTRLEDTASPNFRPAQPQEKSSGSSFKSANSQRLKIIKGEKMEYDCKDY